MQRLNRIVELENKVHVSAEEAKAFFEKRFHQVILGAKITTHA